MKKIIALLLLLFTVTLMFSSCLFSSGEAMREINFSSHSELVDFVEDYNSKNDGFVDTFVSFDFDNNNEVRPYRYCFRSVWALPGLFSKRDGGYKKLYDKNHSHMFDCEMIFHIDDDVDKMYCQIYCFFETNNEYNFYQGDNISIEFVGKYSVYDKWKYIDESNCDTYGFERRFNDIRSYNYDTKTSELTYNIMYAFLIKINDITELNIEITSVYDMTEEQLNYISQLFMDNLVIINTEG